MTLVQGIRSHLYPLLHSGRCFDLLHCGKDSREIIEEPGNELVDYIDMIGNEQVDPGERGTDEMTGLAVFLN